ncbi:unnamed protein product [Ectocarpus sp. 13 AM-2016]
MLRLGQSTSRVTRGVAAACRNNALLPCSAGQQQHGVSMLRALAATEHPKVNSSEHNKTWTTSSGEQRSRAYASRRRLIAWPAAHLPGAVFSGATSKRPMSTAAGTGHSGDVSTTADLGPDAMAGGADTAMAAAGTADQAQAALEVAPETFKMALYTPPQLAMMAVDYVHATTGMPYWMTIVAITVGIRTAILPVGLLAARNGARTAAMKPEMDSLQAAIKGDQQSSQPRKADRYRQETKALFQKHKASLVMNAALPIVQLPLFIGFFLGLRRMPDAVPEFATGGILWFQDLGAPDPYMIFPVMTGVMMMAMAELGGEGGALAGSSVKMKAGMRGMALLVTPLTMYVSTGVFVYWTTSNFYSILQTLAFKSSGIKKFFDFPNIPPNKLKSDPAEKEIGWFDVLGGDHPIKEYRKMQDQRQVQAWFVEGEGGWTRKAHNAEQGEGGNVAREGAPFHPPPSMAGPVSGQAKTTSFTASAAAETPKVVLRSVRPKPTGNRGKTAARGPRKNRG